MSDQLRPSVRAMVGYTPGEQPREGEYIKLNTNENPYPPSPRVLDALRGALSGDRLRRYPDPVGTTFRQAAGRVLGVDPDAILIGNGSDDILTILTRAFVPEGGLVVAPTPSYLLYRTLAQIQNARFETVPFTADWQLPCPWPHSDAHLTFLANPNSPSGTAIDPPALLRFVSERHGPLVIDEAYADFCGHNALEIGQALDEKSPVIISRTMSKSYALAGIRFGFAIAAPGLVRELIKVKDSYNCDVLSLVAATAAIEDQAYFHTLRERILATRRRLVAELASLGFACSPSQANFVWCRHASRAVKPIYEELKRRKILVRWMDYEGYGDGLRISVGSDGEIERLLQELRGLV